MAKYIEVLQIDDLSGFTIPDTTARAGKYYEVFAGGGGGVGTVTSVGVTDGNGFNLTVTNPTSTPNISLATTVTGMVKGNGTALSAASQGTDYYAPGGVDVALADGGTGASLADPNADRVMFWDDSAGAITWLTPGTGLAITDTTIAVSGIGTLDQAYDFGGAGAGRTITADSGAVTITVSNSSNNSGLVINQNDRTNYSRALDANFPYGGTAIQFTTTDDQEFIGGPILSFVYDTTQDKAIIGGFYFTTDTSTSVQKTFASYVAGATVDTNGSEESRHILQTRLAGTLATRLIVGGPLNGINVGASTATGILSSNGNQDLQLQTGNSTTGTITITDGANGNITLAPNGTGLVTTAAVEVVKSGTGATAGGVEAVRIGSGASGIVGIYYGSGAPTVSAPKGSLYLRTDGTTTNDRAYINTDAGTTWTALTTAA